MNLISVKFIIFSLMLNFPNLFSIMFEINSKRSFNLIQVLFNSFNLFLFFSLLFSSSFILLFFIAFIFCSMIFKLYLIGCDLYKIISKFSSSV